MAISFYRPSNQYRQHVSWPLLLLFHRSRPAVSFFNPIGPAAFVALLGVLTVYLLYKIAAKWFNPRVGLISALLFALSPVVIKYSSFSWNPNIMPLFPSSLSIF